MNLSLNDFIHDGATHMFEDNPSKPYIYYEDALRNAVNRLIENKKLSQLNVENWQVARAHHPFNGELEYNHWTLNKTVTSYFDNTN